MSVRSVVRSPVDSPVRSVFAGSQFNPILLFGTGAQGAWYDPSDFSTLYQDSAGTTPVTAVEQPVGLMLDRSGRGNHALQATSASRPVLRARYNLLTYSEEFDNGAWSKNQATITANDITAPNGTLTADRITATGTTAYAQQVFTSIAGTTYTTSVHLKAGNISSADLYAVNQGVVVYVARFTLTGSGTATAMAGSPTVSILALGDGWYRCSMTKIHTAGSISDLVQVIPGDNEATVASNYVYAWGIDLKTAADQTSTGGAYQRIAAATDYDVSNPVWRPYLAFDGVDDSFGTSSIDFSGTDEMTVFAGVTKVVDATVAAIIAELSDASTNNRYTLGGFLVGTPDYYFNTCGGTVTAGALASSSVYAAPVTNVLTGSGDISAPVSRLRINGSVIDTNTATQGTGNYPNAPLFIGRRNNFQFPFNGRIYGLTVLGRTATAAELASMETWVAGKTGVTL